MTDAPKSRSYWRTFLAALGRIRQAYLWAFNIVAWLLIGLSFGYQYLDREIDQKQADYHYQPARDEVGLARPAARQPQAKQYQPNCKAPVGREDSDLCAQWSAVEAVNESNRLTVIYIWLGAITLLMTASGTSLLIWTLWETRQTSRRELRAYITVEDVKATYATRSRFRAFINFVNRGATPAYILDIAYGTWVGPAPMVMPSEEAPRPTSQALVKKFVGKDQGDAIRVWITGNDKAVKETIRRANQKGFDLYIYGWIIYRDVFGAVHYTSFSYIPPTERLGTLLPHFVPTIGGNGAD